MIEFLVQVSLLPPYFPFLLILFNDVYSSDELRGARVYTLLPHGRSACSSLLSVYVSISSIHRKAAPQKETPIGNLPCLLLLPPPLATNLVFCLELRFSSGLLSFQEMDQL